jgi:hypothetical protein
LLPNVFSLLKRHYTADDILLLEPGEVELSDDLLGSGVPSASTFLRGDRTWAAVSIPDPLEITTLRILEPGGPSFISLQAPALAGNVALTLPPDDGDAGEVLTTNGSGVLTWEPAAGGAPLGASYVVVALDGTLTNERRLQAEAGVLLLADGGANGDITLSVATNGISSGKFRQSAGFSVVGRAIGSTGNVADIVAAASDQVLAFDGFSVAFTNGPRVQGLFLMEDSLSDFVLLQAPSVLAGSYTITLPPDNGTIGQLLYNTDGAGTLDWTSTPEAQALLLANDDRSLFITLQAPTGLLGDYALILPVDDGTPNQVLTTNGAGVTSWTTPGAASLVATTVEKNLGSVPVWQGKFTITDAAITATSKVLVWQAPGPYTGKGSALSADEGTMDPILITAVIPATGSAIVHWKHALGLRPVSFPNPSNRTDGTLVAALAGMPRRADDIVFAAAAGRVKGNFKFSYLIAA